MICFQWHIQHSMEVALWPHWMTSNNLVSYSMSVYYNELHTTLVSCNVISVYAWAMHHKNIDSMPEYDTYSGGSICESDLSVHSSHRLQPRSATFSGGGICKSGLSVHNSHGLQPQNYHQSQSEPAATDCSYLHATFSSGGICKSDLSVHNSHSLQPQNSGADTGGCSGCWSTPLQPRQHANFNGHLAR